MGDGRGELCSWSHGRGSVGSRKVSASVVRMIGPGSRTKYRCRIRIQWVKIDSRSKLSDGKRNSLIHATYQEKQKKGRIAQ